MRIDSFPPYFDHIDGFEDFLVRTRLVNGALINGINLNDCSNEVSLSAIKNSILINCEFPGSMLKRLIENGCSILSSAPDIPFEIAKETLYTPQALFEGFHNDKSRRYSSTLDAEIYHYWYSNDGVNSLNNFISLQGRLHDYFISRALCGEIAKFGKLKVVAIMGGHELSRDESTYLEIVLLAGELARKGFLVISGGGPGAMEAAHLGVALAHENETKILDVVNYLKVTKFAHEPSWFDRAYDIAQDIRQEKSHFNSIGIPTWRYGHAPTPFATKIAKFFFNDTRESALIEKSLAGTIFFKGSAGTLQEILQKTSNNHYLASNYISPMVFYGNSYWNHEKPILPLLRSISSNTKYQKMMCITDTVADTVKFLTNSPPIEENYNGFNFCLSQTM
ncbi:MAG: hypothetical protein ABJN69_10765 [Hellea sp.]